MSSLSQALPLGYLPSPHSAFQEHAAHNVKWSTLLSSKGSLGTCIPKGVLHILTLRFHGAHMRHSSTAIHTHGNPCAPGVPLLPRASAVPHPVLPVGPPLLPISGPSTDSVLITSLVCLPDNHLFLQPCCSHRFCSSSYPIYQDSPPQGMY